MVELVNIFLDDIRFPKDCVSYMSRRIGAMSLNYIEKEWIIVRNYEEFIKAIDENKGKIDTISFDHDLGQEHMNDYYKNQVNGIDRIEYENFKEKTGLDCAKYFKEVYKDIKDKPSIYLHSMNPVGLKNMEWELLR